MNELQNNSTASVHKHRFFLELAFDGTAYCGWQRQPNVDTVQQTLEDLLSKIYKEKIIVYGCGRTDSGVHASEYFAHFNVPKQLDYLIKALNAQLPRDILIKRIIPVTQDQHARFDADGRSYTYKLHSEFDPFIRHYSLKTNLSRLNTELMHKACEQFTSSNNYLHLCKFNPDIKEHTSDVKKAIWKELNDGKNVEFHVTANRFLHNQIRRMVGCLLDIGAGRMTLNDLEMAMNENTPLPYATKVAPHGLFLSAIKYPFIN